MPGSDEDQTGDLDEDLRRPGHQKRGAAWVLCFHVCALVVYKRSFFYRRGHTFVVSSLL